MNRFVILTHDYPVLHWDFMLEDSTGLATWRLMSEPIFDDVIPAVQLASHRKAYLDYEGPVSGERGSVTQWDRGKYLVHEWSENCVVCELTGRKVMGICHLTKEEASDSATWRFQLCSETK